jgi:hypothetical protein
MTNSTRETDDEWNEIMNDLQQDGPEAEAESQTWSTRL